MVNDTVPGLVHEKRGGPPLGGVHEDRGQTPVVAAPPVRIAVSSGYAKHMTIAMRLNATLSREFTMPANWAAIAMRSSTAAAG